MTIRTIESRQRAPNEIDLTGPDGEAAFLINAAKNLARALGKDADAITEDMKSGDYEHLLDVFDREFSSENTLFR